MIRFANNFHSWLRHSWKPLANRLTRDPKIVIHGNSCIILYILNRVKSKLNSSDFLQCWISTYSPHGPTSRGRFLPKRRKDTVIVQISSCLCLVQFKSICRRGDNQVGVSYTYGPGAWKMNPILQWYTSLRPSDAYNIYVSKPSYYRVR